MIEFGNITYYIDVDAFNKVVTTTENKPTDKVSTLETRTYLDSNNDVTNIDILETSSDRGREIDTPKYDILRTMIDVILDLNEDTDTSLGADRALSKLTFSQKLAFNTLIYYGIIKEKD